MALVDILEKIKKETDEKIAQLEKEFEGKMKKIEKDENERQKRKIGDLENKLEEMSNKIIEKAENLAEREGKNRLLETKRRVIDKSLQEAIDALSSSTEYEQILIDMLKNTNFDEDAVVISAKGKESATKKAIQASGKNYMLSDKSAEIRGGFILKTEKIEIDNSFETIIGKELREELEIKLNKLLF